MSKPAAVAAWFWAAATALSGTAVFLGLVSSRQDETFVPRGDTALIGLWLDSMMSGSLTTHGHLTEGTFHPSPSLMWISALPVIPLKAFQASAGASLDYGFALTVAAVATKIAMLVATGLFLKAAFRSWTCLWVTLTLGLIPMALSENFLWQTTVFFIPNLYGYIVAVLVSGCVAVLMGSRTALPWAVFSLLLLSPGWLPLLFVAPPVAVVLAWGLWRYADQRRKATIAAAAGLVPMLVFALSPTGLSIAANVASAGSTAPWFSAEPSFITQYMWWPVFADSLRGSTVTYAAPALGVVLAATVVAIPLARSSSPRWGMAVPALLAATAACILLTPHRHDLQGYFVFGLYGVGLMVVCLPVCWAATRSSWAPQAAAVLVVLAAPVAFTAVSSQQREDSRGFYAGLASQAADLAEVHAADFLQANADPARPVAIVVPAVSGLTWKDVPLGPDDFANTVALRLVSRGLQVCLIGGKWTNSLVDSEGIVPAYPSSLACTVSDVAAGQLAVVSYDDQPLPAPAVPSATDSFDVEPGEPQRASRPIYVSLFASPPLSILDLYALPGNPWPSLMPTSAR